MVQLPVEYCIQLYCILKKDIVELVKVQKRATNVIEGMEKRLQHLGLFCLEKKVRMGFSYRVMVISLDSFKREMGRLVKDKAVHGCYLGYLCSTSSIRGSIPLSVSSWEAEVGRIVLSLSCLALKASHRHLVGTCENRFLGEMGLWSDPTGFFITFIYLFYLQV